MKQIIIILLFIVISIISYSQTKTILTKDSTKFISKPIYLNSINSLNNFYQNPFISNYSLKNTSIYSDLLHDSIFINNYYYNNFVHADKQYLLFYKHQFYYVKDPIQPFSDLGMTLLGGTLNYLFLLFNN